jgi:ribosomal-protein-alanine N-acetyltransferase
VEGPPPHRVAASLADADGRQNELMPELMGPAVRAGWLRDQQQPTLHVDDLTLRPWLLSDAPAVVDTYRDPHIQRWHVRSMDEGEARDWVTSWQARWRAESGAGWAITRDGALVGRMTFGHLSLEDGSAEVAYWTVPAARGTGVASRALRTASGWLLTSGGLYRLELCHSVANPASCRVAASAGYLFEGTKRRQGLHADGWHDMHLHALVADDLEAPTDG